MPGITGTRDSFGVFKAFRDEETGRVIDNWKSWEKAGFRSAVEVHKKDAIGVRIKDKIEKKKKFNKGGNNARKERSKRKET